MEAVDQPQAVAVRMTRLNRDVQYRAQQTHHWYDQIVAIVASILAAIRGRKDLEGVRGITPGRAKLLQRGARLSPSANNEFVEVLRTLEGNPFSFVEAYQHQMFSNQLLAMGSAEETQRAVEANLPAGAEGLVFVPLIIGQGRFEAAHIVWVTADRDIGRIEFFDPKGKELVTDSDGNVEVNRDAKHQMISGVIAALGQKYGINRFVQNPVRHQYDIHSCGVQGLKYIAARRQGMTFEQYLLGGEHDIPGNRRSMADAILALQPDEPDEADLLIEF